MAQKRSCPSAPFASPIVESSRTSTSTSTSTDADGSASDGDGTAACPAAGLCHGACFYGMPFLSGWSTLLQASAIL